ncbi:type I-B CRISPR-associated protein Cas8b1/Cst1 [Clostridium sp. UBA7339]|uniref:type I-B CRISPR-associated protein Cas8b1/Cst1 n=1 Tax=Clostridium sp. UBA7339 TaxID=1946376 RepID=UPI0032170808
MKIYLSDWLYNSGILGLYNALKHGDKNIKLKNNYIEFEEEELVGFEEDYFNYLISKNNDNLTSSKIVDRILSLERFKDVELTEKDIDNINELIKYTKDKFNSNSYKSAFNLVGVTNEVELIVKELKVIKISKKQCVDSVKDEVYSQIITLYKIKDILTRENTEKYVKAKNVMYDIIDKFWSGVGILHKTKNNDDMYKVYQDYFLNSAKVYNKDNKGKYWCMTCNNPLKSLSESYNLSWLEKMGADMNKKSSHFWNLNGDSYICPICNLVYSCIPLGFNFVLGKGIFINNNSSVKKLLNANKTAGKISTVDDVEEQSYFNILDDMEQDAIEKNRFEIDNIQVVRYDSENSSRPYTFNILSKSKLEVIYKYKDILSRLINMYVEIDGYYINLYREVLKRLYENRNMYDLIYLLLKKEHGSKTSDYTYVIKNILRLNLTLNERGGERSMANYYKIDRFTKYGQKVKKEYEDKNSENKLAGISYRLLNALKVNNSDKFMDTLINSYMYIGMEIPTEFSNVLLNDDEFKSAGYAFMVGLQGKNYKENSEEESK